jgi:hypothetical protein
VGSSLGIIEAPTLFEDLPRGPLGIAGPPWEILGPSLRFEKFVHHGRALARRERSGLVFGGNLVEIARELGEIEVQVERLSHDSILHKIDSESRKIRYSQKPRIYTSVLKRKNPVGLRPTPRKGPAVGSLRPLTHSAGAPPLRGAPCGGSALSQTKILIEVFFVFEMLYILTGLGCTKRTSGELVWDSRLEGQLAPEPVLTIEDMDGL